jgi:hypothetical protein
MGQKLSGPFFFLHNFILLSKIMFTTLFSCFFEPLNLNQQ